MPCSVSTWAAHSEAKRPLSDLIRPPIPRQNGQSGWSCDRVRWVILTGATFALFERGCPGRDCPCVKYTTLRLDGLSKRRIAVGLNIGRTAVGDYLRRERRAGLAWPLPEGLSDEALERLLFAPPAAVSPDRRPLPDWPLLHRELKRPGVTLSLLWEEYRTVPRRLRLHRFRSLPGSRPARPDHAPDPCHKLFVDYAGATADVIDVLTGEVRTDPSPPWAPPARRGDLDAGCGSARTAAPSPISAGCDRSYRTISNPVSSRPASIPRSTELTPAGGPLRHRHRADAAAQTTRQSESGSRRPGRRTLDPGPPAKPSSASRN